MKHITEYTDNEIEVFLKRLRFPSLIEKQFRKSYRSTGVNFNSRGGIIFVFIYFMNIFTDFYAFPELSVFSVVNRTAVLVFGLFCFHLASLKNADRFYDYFILAGFSAVCMLLIIYSVIGQGMYRYLYHSGFMLVLVGFFVLRFRFSIAITFGIFFVISHVGLNLLFNSGESIKYVLHNSGNIAGMLFCGAIISYLNEYQYRKSFFQMMQIDAEKENVKRRNHIIEQDLLIARKIQMQHIPTESPVPFINSIYEPMEKVGGDFFDYILFPDARKIGVFISDVSGHGVSAAYITAMIKTSILQAKSLTSDPAMLLDFINDNLINNTADSFVTAIYGIFHIDERKFVYSNAGHNHPFLVADEGAVSVEAARSIPLAVFTSKRASEMNKKWCNNTIDLADCSKIFLYTDGLCEARSEDGLGIYSEAGELGISIHDNRKLEGKLFLEAVFNQLVNFRGSKNFEDDICMICIDTCREKTSF